MPTENQSSNTEMVSVPREPSAQMLDAARNAAIPMVHVDSMRARQDLEFSARYKAAISQCTQPAPQPHPDPIAWMVGTAFWWTKEEAERDAAATGLPIVGLGPMAGHGEVELCEARLHEVASLCASVEQERDALRAQLAERDTLPQFAQTVIRKLKRFRDCAEDGQGADIGKAWFDVLVQLGLLNRVQRSPAWWKITDESEALLDGRVALSASAEPSAPVEIDERAEFEQACRDAAAARGRELDPESLRRRTDGSHVNPLTECGWWGWQARAALGRKPQVKP